MNTLLRILGLEEGAHVSQVNEWNWLLQTAGSSAGIYAVVLVGAVLALVNFLPRLAMRRSTRIWTFVLRIGITGLILAILCGLTLHVNLDMDEDQEWLVLVDDSASMATPDHQSASRFAGASADAKSILENASPAIKLRVKSFSGHALADSAGKGPTPLENAIRSNALSRVEYDRLILLTDGRDSDGRDLSKLGEDLRSRGIALSVKVYGSEVTVADSAIQAIAENNVLRLGDELRIRGDLVGSATGIHNVT
ncbi:MAG: hypothetical protein ACI8W8_003311, partial [Rhodothermales bacterium]